MSLHLPPKLTILGAKHLCASHRGNWSVDLQAGSQFGYKLLFAVLLSGIGAVILQVSVISRTTREWSEIHAYNLQALACKLGCVTGLGMLKDSTPST